MYGKNAYVIVMAVRLGHRQTHGSSSFKNRETLDTGEGKSSIAYSVMH